jgi:hypothetical protein
MSHQTLDKRPPYPYHFDILADLPSKIIGRPCHGGVEPPAALSFLATQMRRQAYQSSRADNIRLAIEAKRDESQRHG